MAALFFSLARKCGNHLSSLRFNTFLHLPNCQSSHAAEMQTVEREKKAQEQTSESTYAIICKTFYPKWSIKWKKQT